MCRKHWKACVIDIYILRYIHHIIQVWYHQCWTILRSAFWSSRILYILVWSESSMRCSVCIIKGGRYISPTSSPFLATSPPSNSQRSSPLLHLFLYSPRLTPHWWLLLAPLLVFPSRTYFSPLSLPVFSHLQSCLFILASQFMSHLFHSSYLSSVHATVHPSLRSSSMLSFIRVPTSFLAASSPFCLPRKRGHQRHLRSRIQWYSGK